MQLYLLVIGSITLFYASASPSTHSGLIDNGLHQNEGYQCGRRVLSQNTIDEAAKQANEQALVKTALGAERLDLSHLKVYQGPLNFGNNRLLLLWPIMNLRKYAFDTATYFIVMIELDHQRLETVGVMRQNDITSLSIKCIKELDISGVLGNDFAEGYCCPNEVFSFNVLKSIVGSAAFFFERALGTPRKDRYPIPYDARPLFNLPETYWSWPFQNGKNFHATARSSIVMDRNHDLKGVIYKRNDQYIRCKLTIFKNVVPKFAGHALEMRPKSVDRNSVDVFQCGSHYITSREVLKGASFAPNGFTSKRTNKKLVYPSRYETSNPDTSIPLYLWPVYSNPKIKERPAYAKHVRYQETFFAVIDDFSDVYNLLMVQENKSMVECERKTIPNECLMDYRKRFDSAF